MNNNNNNNNNNSTTATLIATASMVVIATMMMTVGPSTVLAQQQGGEVFESEEDGFRLQIPAGWVIEDFDNMPAEENREDIALLCPANEALPGIGGESNCLAANTTDAIYISRLPDLQSIPEFEDLETLITTNDLLALSIQTLQNGNRTSDIQIQNNTDLDEFRKIVNMTYTFYDDAGTVFNPFDDYSYNVKSLEMFVLIPDDRNMGYHIFNRLATPNALNVTEHSPAVNEVFSTFQIVEGTGGGGE